MVYAINVSNWDDTWSYIGREIEEERRGEWDYDNEDGVCNDDYYPMMLYAYPLDHAPDEERIIEVHERTACTVVGKEGEYYIALCGGGMDLSQDIALAYIILEKVIPTELAIQVSTQYGLSQSGEDYVRVMEGVKRSLENDIHWATVKIKQCEEGLKKALPKAE